MSKLAIIITVHNRNDKRLKNCLRSLIAQDTVQDYEIFVVDYASTDDLPSMIGELNSDKILYVHVDKPTVNISHGNNIAIQNTDAEWICVTDGNFVFQNNFVDNVFATMGQNLILVCTGRPYYVPEMYIENETYDFVVDFDTALTAPGVGKGSLRPQSSILVMERERTLEIRGYDEEVVAAEDTDILRRFLTSGAFLTRLDTNTSLIYQTFTQAPEVKQAKGQAELVNLSQAEGKAALRRKSPIRNLGREFGVL